MVAGSYVVFVPMLRTKAAIRPVGQSSRVPGDDNKSN